MSTYSMNQYQQNQIATASPERILLMLYDGAIRFTRQALQGIEEQRPEQKRYGIGKAMAIISEFSNSLNHEIGGKIAEDLDALYDFMIRELMAANLKDDADKLANVEKLLGDLRQTWAEAIELNKKQAAAPAANFRRPVEEHYTPLAISS
ncbi:flagellar export chaperone FliS [Desulfofustis limnaeus]|uniref:Flagellar secretion chaperone FliS n=1 Tax=Desulfofustis limnaeus TaxID=2740163 RepID=A0ABM7W8R5_9BACT|nr:flagellar export chaperone FliS [Desulfofustis limnaeus]BDD87371.1 flagellar protein FliS [Desulfofustis limnaeus]